VKAAGKKLAELIEQFEFDITAAELSAYLLNRAMPDGLPGSDNSGDRRRTSLWPRDQRPADGFHQKFIDSSN
jgi:hypothetical protein